MSNTLLRFDASARRTGSISRDLTDQVIAQLADDDAEIITRDLADNLPLIDEAWISANFNALDDRTEAQKATLAFSDSLVSELQAPDTIVLGVPVYNFSVPAALKAWIDLVARAGVTFKYSAEGPEGLLANKKAVVVIASGGTEFGSDIDFAGRYIKHVLGFIGITDVQFIRADRMMVDAETTMATAQADLQALAA